MEAVQIQEMTLDQFAEARIDQHPRQYDLERIVGHIRRFGFRVLPILDITTGKLVRDQAFAEALILMQAAGEAVPENVTITDEGEWAFPIHVTEFPGEYEAKSFILGMGAVEEAAIWDEALLHGWMTDLLEHDQGLMEGLGLDEELHDLQESLLADGISDADVPPPNFEELEAITEKWNVREGELFIIPSEHGGEHRLLCGDSTNEVDVKRLMNGQKARLFATDPPYLVEYDGDNHPSGKVWDDYYFDSETGVDGDPLYDAFIQVAIEHAIEPNAALYCWHASSRQGMVVATWERHGILNHQQIIWFKNNSILGHSMYMWQHEPCLMGWIKGNKPDRYGDMLTSVWQFDRQLSGHSMLHPTSKPIELFVIPMRQHTKLGAICYEPFSGSGSQLLAGEKAGRLVYAMEKQPAFVAVALERLESMGLTPERVDHGESQ